MESKKIYLNKGTIVYDPETMILIEAWGFCIEEELKHRGIKYNPNNYYYIAHGSCKAYTRESLNR